MKNLVSVSIVAFVTFNVFGQSPVLIEKAIQTSPVFLAQESYQKNAEIQNKNTSIGSQQSNIDLSNPFSLMGINFDKKNYRGWKFSITESGIIKFSKDTNTLTLEPYYEKYILALSGLNGKVVLPNKGKRKSFQESIPALKEFIDKYESNIEVINKKIETQKTVK